MTQTAISEDRRYAAVEKEIPTPVANAMYVATHSGHFGIKARIALGTIHLAATTPRPKMLGRAYSQHL